MVPRERPYHIGGRSGSRIRHMCKCFGVCDMCVVGGWVLVGIGFGWIVKFSHVDVHDTLRSIHAAAPCYVGFSDPVTAEQVNQFTLKVEREWTELLVEAIAQRRNCIFPAIMMLGGVTLTVIGRSLDRILQRFRGRPPNNE